MSDRMPLFSVCIPCFNHGQYIGQTITSVLEQDFDDFEIVVADNASTDNSRDMVRSFDDKRIRLLENRFNIGFAPNLQQVTRQAQGKFINLLSSDDVMEKGTLRQYSELIREYSESAERLILMSQAWEIDGGGDIVRYITKRERGLAPVRVELPSHEQILTQPLVEVHKGAEVFGECMRSLETAGVFCTVVYSRELWEQVEGYNSTQLMNPDKHFMMKILRRDPLVVFVNRPLYSYRKHVMGQAAQQARAGILKFQMDQCNFLAQFDDKWLVGTGVTKEEQIERFVERDCLDHALVSLSNSQWTRATRLLAFAWSSFPSVVLRSWKSYALGALLLLGPVGIGVARVLRFARDFRRPPRHLKELGT